MSTHFAAYPAGRPADRDGPEHGERVDLSTMPGARIIQFAVSHPRGDVTLIVVAGEIDLCTAPRLRDMLLRAYGSRVSTMVVDLSPVTFFAAAGLTTLIEAQAAAEQAAGRMVLITTVRCVDRVIEITGLSTTFRRVGSLAAALAETATGCEAGV
ncbi:STAS domain-containing protein [Nocardia sp. NBC_00565]|uniref:STAS domain-containing protein n=1 Tax=Nocardia sp. NBC_00565 TaxID=2975993 RepID=UPI002E8044EE|nr:STAS domain-containing protein [Nocardia sp. NBC_00565]WUC00454.1 STAS domain-containing protein [Nocardia sp. NBC_00565]